MIHRIINTADSVIALYASQSTPSMMVNQIETPCNCKAESKCHAAVVIGMKRDRYLWRCLRKNAPTQLLWKETKRTGEVFGNRTEWVHLFADDTVPFWEEGEIATVALPLPPLFADVEVQLPDLFEVIE